MRIVVLGNKEQEEELLSQGKDESTELTRVKVPAEITGAADACIDLLFDNTEERAKKLQQLPVGIVIINSVVQPLNKSTSGFVRINGWNTFLKRSVIEAAGDETLKEKATTVFLSLNKRVEWADDITGFFTARVVASVINEAYFTLEEKVSTKDEIDIAMKLGTNYPYGPFEWSEKIGTKNIFELLSLLAQEQKRYEPARTLITRMGKR